MKNCIRIRLAAFFPAFILIGCAGLPAISTNVSFCCTPQAATLSTYRVEFEDMPEFLKPMMRDEASIVLDQKGLQYTESSAQAILHMLFVATPLEAEPRDNDAAWGTIEAGGTARFNAEVRMEFRNAVTREVIWAGSMAKLHNVGPGAYMHEAPARRAVREAMLVLFADYPMRAINKM
ncbi:MAG: hypothetical protein KJO31_05245 [Gammaproteobacteria bacterium]|nr:hypothetical protein [Gammaproteobacteria bacterium]